MVGHTEEPSAFSLLRLGHMGEYFAPVLNLIDPSEVIDVEIVPGFRLRRPTVEQKAIWLAYLDRSYIFPPRHVAQTPREYYEFDATFVKAGNGTRLQRTPLKEQEWRYFVIEFGTAEDDLNAFHALRPLLNASVPEIRTSSTLASGTEAGLGGGGPFTPVETIFWIEMFFDESQRTPAKVTSADVSRYRESFEALRGLTGEHPWVGEALRMLYDLGNVPHMHALRVLGLFTVLEALLLHQPGSHLTGDSLRHQLQTKMTLVERKMPFPLLRPYSASEVTNKTLWNKLYDARSAIAHGEHLDFKGTVEILGSLNDIRHFLRSAVKGVFAVAMDEPDLIRDLQAC